MTDRRRPVPSPPDERTADISQRDALIIAHLPLARSLARRYVGHGEGLDELAQVAGLGLVKAAGRFDCSRGTAFGHFATVTIVGELKRHCRDTRWRLHVSRSAQEAYLRVCAATEWAARDLGRPPKASEIGERVAMSESEVLAAQAVSACLYVLSSDAPVGDEYNPVTPQFGLLDRAFADADDRIDLDVMLRRVSARDRQILRLRFDADLTQSQIGRCLGLSQMHVSKLLSDALGVLRDSTREEAPSSA